MKNAAFYIIIGYVLRDIPSLNLELKEGPVEEFIVVVLLIFLLIAMLNVVTGGLKIVRKIKYFKKVKE